MKNMTIRTKMILGFAVPIILSIINVALGMLAVRNVTNSVADMQTEEFVTIQQTMEEIGADQEKSQILIDTITQVKTKDMANIQKTTNLSNMASAGLILVSVVISLFIAIALIKIIRKSIEQLSNAATEIAMGHVNIELEKYNNDEFGEMVEEYRKVIDNIKNQAQIAEEISKGNLTITVVPKSAEDLLGNSLKKLVDDNLNALTNISDAGSQVTISSSQVASASQALAQGSTEQASAIQEITSSIGEIAEKTKRNAEEANEAAGLVVQAIRDVKQGNTQMKDMMVAMKDINKYCFPDQYSCFECGS